MPPGPSRRGLPSLVQALEDLSEVRHVDDQRVPQHGRLDRPGVDFDYDDIAPGVRPLRGLVRGLPADLETRALADAGAYDDEAVRLLDERPAVVPEVLRRVLEACGARELLLEV